jgi:hypothetical protein
METLVPPPAGPAASSTPLICAACGALTAEIPCTACSRNPMLQGRYRLLQVHGGDPSGMAYLAADSRRPDQAVIVRLVPLSPDDAEHLGAEVGPRARALRELDHAGVRPLFSAFLVGRNRRQALAEVHPALPGEPLIDRVRGAPLPEAEVVDVLRQVLAAVRALHELSPPQPAGAVTPQRLLRQPNGRVVLMYPGGLEGPRRAGAPWSPGDDLRAVGMLGVSLVTGQGAETFADPRGWLSWEHRARASAGLVELISRLLDPDPTLRPASAADALRELQALDQVVVDADLGTLMTPAPSLAPRPPTPESRLEARTGEHPALVRPRLEPHDPGPPQPSAETSPAAQAITALVVLLFAIVALLAAQATLAGLGLISGGPWLSLG